MQKAILALSLLLALPASSETDDELKAKLKSSFTTIITCTSKSGTKSFFQLSMTDEWEKYMDAIVDLDMPFSTTKGMYSSFVDEEGQILMTKTDVPMTMEGKTKFHKITLTLGDVTYYLVETKTDVWEHQDPKGKRTGIKCVLEERAQLARALNHDPIK